MSKLDELIAELCPDGVEYASIGSLIKRIRERGKDDISVQQVYVVSNSLGIVRAEDYRDNTIHSEDTSNYTIIRKNMFAYNPSRLNIGSIAMLKEEEPGLVSPMYVVFSIDETQIVKEYFEYVLKSPYVMNKINSYKEEGARFRFNFDRWDWIRIPLPPLPVQQEIVRILDNFTELTAELTARRKQYEYYRNLLLTFSDDVEWKPLKESIISLTTGLNPRHFFRLNTDDAHNYYVTIREIRNNTIIFSDRTDRINDEALRLCNNRSNLEVGDVLFSGTGTIGETAVISTPPTNWNIKEGVYAIKPDQKKLLPRFLMYLLQSDEIRSNYLAKAEGGTVKSVQMKAMKELKIPIPPLEVQERIVAILDRFNALCNDLTSGIPAEIEARQKQYEYYRDRLLSFKEVSA